MKLHLAPMEGIVDWVVRDVLTAHGGVDQCVTEFVRVTDRVVVDHVFHAYCPELKINSRTRSGTPVLMQLLGGHPEPMAASAARAVALGAYGIDLNFGCPAKTVNRHEGGAILLKTPDRIFNILKAVRASVPEGVPVTAKIRLGVDDPSMCLPVAQAVEAAGIKKLTVHCRTKKDMYTPPAYWDWIPKIKAVTTLEIIANGEVWTVDDYWRCREVTGCSEVMIGRGAIADPFIFAKIKTSIAERAINEPDALAAWRDIQPMFSKFYVASRDFKGDSYAQARTKQWLSQIAKRNAHAKVLFDTIKTVKSPTEFFSML